MSSVACPREADILEAVILGRWPDDLRRHADGCPVCGDLAVVAVALQDERDDALQEARLPTSGQVWWRASTRARTEAAATAARPITMLQGLAGACAAGVCAAAISLGWPSIREPLTSIAEAFSRGGERFGAAAVWPATMEQTVLSVVALLSVAVILAPFFVYLLLSED